MKKSLREKVGSWLIGPQEVKEFRGQPIIASDWQTQHGVAIPASHKDYYETYASHPWVFASIKKMANSIKGVPLRIYKDVVIDGKIKPMLIDKGPLVDLFWRPNPFTPLNRIIENIVIDLMCTGNAYLAIENRGKELWNMWADQVKIIPDKTTYVAGYEFVVNNLNGPKTIRFLPEEVIHFKFPNPINPYYGLSPLAAAVVSIVMDISATNFNKSFFKKGCTLSGILTTEKEISEDTKKAIKAEFENSFLNRDGKNAHRVAFFSGGLKWEPTSVNQRDMEFMALRKMNREEILACIGMPPSVVGLLEYANYANMKEQNKILWDNNLTPLVLDLADVLNISSLFRKSKDLYCKFDLSQVQALKEDEKQKADTAKVLIDGRVMTPSEIRDRFFDLPPMTPEQLDEFPTPQAFNPFGQGQPNQEPKPGDEKSTEVPQKPNFGMSKTGDEGESLPIKLIEAKGELKEPIEAEIEPIKPKVIVLSEFEKAKVAKHGEKLDRHEAELKKFFIAHFEDQQERIIKRLHGDLKNYGLGCKYVDSERLNQIVLNSQEEAEKLYKKLEPKIKEYVKESGDETFRYLNDLGANLNFSFSLFNPHIQEYFKRKIKFSSEQIEETTEAAIRKSLAQGMEAGEPLPDLQKRVLKYFKGEEARAMMIARTEAGNAVSFGHYQADLQSGVTMTIKWLHSNDEFVRPSHQIDETIKLGGVFSNGLKVPHDPDGPADEIINCRCDYLEFTEIKE